jgi:hypothetical protein
MKDYYEIQFCFFDAVQQDYEDKKNNPRTSKKDLAASAKKVAELTENRKFAMLTSGGEQVDVLEGVTYKVKIVKAYVNKGVEFCSMIIKDLNEEQFDWVRYSNFKFV